MKHSHWFQSLLLIDTGFPFFGGVIAIRFQFGISGRPYLLAQKYASIDIPKFSNLDSYTSSKHFLVSFSTKIISFNSSFQNSSSF
mmetsp:Transcript_4646/g.9960  ORF Transcript_4646/g.9960 Transcript_4646/m.9960 type:complete len:85 (+) Transcript_4646:106-360(+)